MAANVSGTVLSSIFYDHLNSQGDQEGYLLGKIVNHVKDNISDSQISTCKVETGIYIYSYIPWPSEEKFYNAAGRVNPTKAITLLQGKHRDLIGWYKFRRNSTLRPSLMERNLHRNLLMSLPVEDHNNFLFFLSSSSLSANKATHNFDHILMRQQGGKFHKVAISVLNLGDTTHTEYKTEGNLTVDPCAGSLRALVDRFQDDFVSGSGGMFEINRIQGMSASLHMKLDGLSEQVQQSEVELSALEEEVKLMTYRLMEHEERQKAELMAHEEKKKAEEMKEPQSSGQRGIAVQALPNVRKLSVNLSDHRLRVNLGEQGRRPRQISVEDEKDKKTTQPQEVNLLDLVEDSVGGSQPLQPTVTNSMDANSDSVEETSDDNRTEQVMDTSSKDKQMTQGASAETENRKSSDVFSFVSGMLEKEMSVTSKPSTSQVKHQTSKEMNVKGGITATRRQNSRERAADSRISGVAVPSASNSRGNSPSRTKSSALSDRGERSRLPKSKVGQNLRSRSRETPQGNQRPGSASSSSVSASRTKSASPGNCRNPIRRTACENGTDSVGVIGDRKLSSSPVF